MLLVFDVKADDIDFVDLTVVVVEKLNLVSKRILNGSNEVIMQHRGSDNALFKIEYDWEAKHESFLVRLVIRGALCPTREVILCFFFILFFRS